MRSNGWRPIEYIRQGDAKTGSAARPCVAFAPPPQQRQQDRLRGRSQGCPRRHHGSSARTTGWEADPPDAAAPVIDQSKEASASKTFQ